MYLLLHTTYTSVEIALCKEGTIVSTLSINKYDASANLIVAIDTLCKQANIGIADLDYIVVHVGPGPFTTLRTNIATANGIAFASGIKLVGVDGLYTFVSEHHNNKEDHATVALLNAYSSDLYYAVLYQGQIKTGILYGLNAITEFIQKLPNTSLNFIGNGVTIHQTLLQELCGSRAIITIPVPENCSLQAVAYQGWLQWKNHEHVADQLTPLYLKQYSAPLKPMKNAS